MKTNFKVPKTGGEILLQLCILILVMFILTGIGCWLWNILMPMIFGLCKLTYWQFFGLELLIEILMPAIKTRKED